MKLKLFPLILLGIYFANSSEFSSKLPQRACKVVSEAYKKEIWMKTIAIVKFEKNFDKNVIDNLMMCLPMEVAVIQMDMMSYNMKLEVIHNVHFVIVLLDEFDQEKLNKFGLLVYDLVSKPRLDHNSKFLILTSNVEKQFHMTMLRHLNDVPSIVNTAILFEKSGDVFADFNNNPKAALKLNSVDELIIDKIYPDHQKDLKGHRHMIVITSQKERVRIENGVLRAAHKEFLKIVQRFENSEMVYNLLKGTREQIMYTYGLLYSNKQFQMTLNTQYFPSSLAPQLMTYEETAYCSLVPIPQKKTLSLSFFKPFDASIWITIVITIVSCMIVWRLYGTSTSIWYIPFFFWTFALGQVISFTTKRIMLIILLQILVFALFILGNAYQGIITSVMIQPDTVERIKTFEELLKSGYKVSVSLHEHQMLQEYPNYREASVEGKIHMFNLTDKANLTDLYAKNIANFLPCDLARYLIATGEASRFYIIDEKMFSSFTQLQVTFLNKFLRRWQLIMDWCFEAGLPKAWDKMTNDENIFKEIEEDASDILMLEHVAVIFYTLILGCLLGFLALLCEIFWHNFVNPYLERRNDKANCKPERVLWRELRNQRIKIRPFEMIEMQTLDEINQEEVNEERVDSESKKLSDIQEEESDEECQTTQVVEAEIHSSCEGLRNEKKFERFSVKNTQNVKESNEEMLEKCFGEKVEPLE